MSIKLSGTRPLQHSLPWGADNTGAGTTTTLDDFGVWRGSARAYRWRHLLYGARRRFDDGPKKIANALLENLIRKGDAKRAPCC